MAHHRLRHRRPATEHCLTVGLAALLAVATNTADAKTAKTDGTLGVLEESASLAGAALLRSQATYDMGVPEGGMVWLQPSRSENVPPESSRGLWLPLLRDARDASPGDARAGDASPGPLDILFWRQFSMTTLPLRWTTPVDWFLSDFQLGRHYRFADLGRFSLLRRYAMPSVERYQPQRVAFAGPFSTPPAFGNSEYIWRLDPAAAAGDSAYPPSVTEAAGDASGSYGELARGASETFAPLRSTLTDNASLRAVPPLLLPLMKKRVCPAWSAPREVWVTNGAADADRIAIIECDGSLSPFALDRVSVLARIPSVNNPGTPLPDEPRPPPAWPDEWVDGVRLLHPRLLWVIQQLGEAFPRRAIQIMSGYRRDARPTSMHRQGRAIDVQVRGVESTALFAYCRSLKDVGCGFYPNHPFVHIDVRSAGGKSVLWVDTSMPGEPSQYVDAWPGVLESGGLSTTDTE